MASILRVKAAWTGFQGAPGYNLFHFGAFSETGFVPADAQSCVTRVKTFFDGIQLYMPNAVRVQVQGDVEVLDPTNGTLQDVYSTTQPSYTQGNSGSVTTFASAVGAVVGWRTSQVRNGRRIRGRTFLVPLSSGAFEADGTLNGGVVTGISTAATTLKNSTGAAGLGVWGRPSAPGATDGVWAPATAVAVPDMGAVLRSRRD